MIALVDTIFVKHQLGPTLNINIAVSAIEGSGNIINGKDKLETDTFTMYDSVEVFFKFKWITDTCNIDTFLCMTKKETEDNSAVGITIACEKLKTCYVQCTNTQIEIPLSNYGYTSKTYVGSQLWMLLYKIEITLTIKEMSMKNRLYEDTECTDFQLQASDGSVAVHKAMLSVHSDTFKTLLRGEWKETAEGRITMDWVTVQDLQHLKDYMYLGTLPDEGLERLMRLADFYLIDKLKRDLSKAGDTGGARKRKRFVKHQLGPTLNINIAVSAIEGSGNIINGKDKLETDTFTMYDSVEVFFKFKWITDTCNIDTFLCMTKKETEDNSAVGITIACEKLKTCYVQCTNTQIEIPLSNYGYTSKTYVGSQLWMLLYITNLN